MSNELKPCPFKPLLVRELPGDRWEVDGYREPLTLRQMLHASWLNRRNIRA